MKTFVLVHGSWHGGWCWKDVARRIRSLGNEVFTPTLSGLGERSHLQKCRIDLTTHIEDISNLINFEDLDNIVLVGHSYGGVVVTGVASILSQRIAKLVYLDAFIPDAGQREFDLLDSGEAIGKKGDFNEDGIWFRPPASLQYLGVEELENKDWIASRLTRLPLEVYNTPCPLPLDEAKFNSIPRTYIHCIRGPSAKRFAPFAEKARRNSWKYYQLSTGHDAMLTMPQQVASLLLEAAK